MVAAHVPAVDEIYRWAGKQWRVVSVDVPNRRATVVNTARPENTATMPFSQFVPAKPDWDPDDSPLPSDDDPEA